jgi:ubiquinone/menaquinone biosynthesis C-methylase UbiE
MNMQINHTGEQQTAIAFTQQAAIFDELYATNRIIQYKRSRVRQHLLQYLEPVSRILELNAGTGDDAIFLANNGHSVHATDIAVGMQEKLSTKVVHLQLTDRITNELCSFTSLDSLKNKGPFDCIFSNFAGLNCTGELQAVLDSFDSLVKPGALVTLVVLPKFCLWETALIIRGKFKTATRRFFSSKGRKAKIDGNAFTCWYYSPGFIERALHEKFDLISIEGLCSLVPPSYIEGFAERYPKIFSWLCKAENKLKSKWPWKYVGDYYIISFKKR